MRNNYSTQLNGVDDISVDIYLRSLEDRVRYMNKADLLMNGKMFEEELACTAQEDDDYELKLAVLEVVRYLLTTSFNIPGLAKAGKKKRRKTSGKNNSSRHKKRLKRDNCSRQPFKPKTCNETPLDDMTSSWILERKKREEKQKQQRQQRQQRRLSRMELAINQSCT